MIQHLVLLAKDSRLQQVDSFALGNPVSWGTQWHGDRDRLPKEGEGHGYF